MKDDDYKPFIDHVLCFIADKYFYTFIITLIFGVVFVFINKIIGTMVLVFSTFIYLLLYFIYKIKCKKKEVYKEYHIDISKYFDNVKYDLYNDDTDE